MNDISEIIKRYSKIYPFAIITHDIELIFKVCNSVLMLGKNGYKKVNIQGHEKEILEFIKDLSLIHISEPTRQCCTSRMPSSA